MTTAQDAASTTEAPTHGVTLTDAAAVKAKALLDQEGRDDMHLRIAVQPGGCAGLRYQLFFDERALDGDAMVDFNGMKVAVDRMSAPYVEGRCHRLRGHDREAGLHDRQPERRRVLRLRRLVPLRRTRGEAAFPHRRERGLSVCGPGNLPGMTRTDWDASR